MLLVALQEKEPPHCLLILPPAAFSHLFVLEALTLQPLTPAIQERLNLYRWENKETIGHSTLNKYMLERALKTLELRALKRAIKKFQYCKINCF